MIDIKDQIIENLKKANPPQGNYIPPNDTFSQILDRVVLNQTDKSTFRSITFITKKYSRGLDEFRKNNLLLGEQYVDEGDIWFNRFPNGSLKDLINVFRLPTVAYLNFKLLKFDLSQKQIQEAFNIDESLEKDDFYFLHFHRIQQLQNIARLLFAQKLFKEWSEAMLEILLYLTKFQSPGYGGSWGEKHVTDCPVHWRFSAMYQLLIEAITFNNYASAYTDESGHSLLDSVISKIPSFEVKSKDELALLKWIMIQNNSNLEERITSTFEFIEEEDSKFDILKVAALESLNKKIVYPNNEKEVGSATYKFVTTKLSVPNKVLNSFYQ